MAYGYHMIHPFDPHTQSDIGFNYQSRKGHLYYILTFQIHHIDYPSRGFTELKYSDALTPTYLEVPISS